MKKSYIIYGVIAMASVMACNKVETNEQVEQENSHSVIYATSETTKTTITDTGISLSQVEWLDGDEAMVYNTTGTGKIFIAQNGGSTAKFVSADGLNGDYCAAVYPASLAKGCDNGPIITAEVPSRQDGDFRNLVFAGVPKASGSNQFLFTAVTSIIKINVPSEKDIVKIEVISNNICGRFTATYNNYKWTTANGDNLSNIITVTAEQGHTLPETVYIAVLPTSSNPEITINGYKSTDISEPSYNKTATLATTLKANVIENFGTIQKHIYNPKAFTIDADGHQVFIAPGNLQYQASTKTWRFAEHQWDYVGYGNDNTTTNGTVYVGSTKSTNENIGETYDGWIDLFGFGTTGFSNMYPYMKSGEANDYPDVNLSLNYNFVFDWGRYCDISNDTYKDKKWHTITQEEWEYLHGRENNTKWGYITIKNIEVEGTTIKKTIIGQLLVPDGFVSPEGVTFVSGHNNNTVTVYSLEDFQKMEAAGAVLLPYCGYRHGGYSTTYLNVYGRYHTNLKGKPLDIYNTPYGCGHTGSYTGYQFYAVRLVRDVPAE